MIYGIGTGILWAMETVLLSIVLMNGVYQETPQAIFLAPFISAFINDTFSSVWLFIFRKTNKKYRSASVWEALRKKNGRLLILSGIFGGPLGMSTYLLGIKFIGASYTAAISALFPVFGAIISRIFLKEKLSRPQMIGIALCGLGVMGMTGQPQDSAENILYFGFAFACALFWALEGVISQHAMREGDITSEIALQIRHMTSVLCYGVVFLPLLGAWGFTLRALADVSVLRLLFLTALLETGSYLLYYKAIYITGASKAMALNVTYIIWALLFSAVLFQDLPEGYEIISMVILMSGIILAALFKAEKTKAIM